MTALKARAGALACVLLPLAAACTPASARLVELSGSTGAASPARPDSCQTVRSGTSLVEALEKSEEGARLCLEPGTYAGPVTIARRTSLWGPPDAVVRSTGTGTTLFVTAAGTRLSGFTIDGSGDRVDLLDAAVKVQGADDVVVEGVRIANATFGILSERTKGLVLRGCTVQGSGDPHVGMRGDSIRLWETYDARVEENRVAGGRDIVVWYSSRNRLERNEVQGGRYGAHFMFSHDNVVRRNRFTDNVVGVFVMYSRNVTLERNLLAGSVGAAGIGIGLKESGNVVVRENRLVRNTSGLYLDTTPLQITDENLFERNVIRLGETGVVFHSSAARNRFLGNSLRDNHVHVRVEGGGDALGVEWRGNDFDDYAGYDLDGDGTGDLPHEARSLSSEWTQKNADLRFFEGSPALAFVDIVGRALPLLAPKPVLRDPAPRMAPLELEEAHAR